MARKNPSKKDVCDICGTALDDDAVIQEFPDGSLVRLCGNCAEGAAFDPEEEAGQDPKDVEDFETGEDFEGGADFRAGENLEAGDETAEWTSPIDDQPTAVDLFADEAPLKSGRSGGRAAKTEADERLQAEVFDSELFDAEAPGSEDSDDAFDREDVSASEAEAELAAWAAAQPGEIEIEEDVDFATEEEREAAHEAALELASALVEEDMEEEMADTARLQILPESSEEEAAEEEEAAAEQAAEPLFDKAEAAAAFAGLPAVLPPPLPRTDAVAAQAPPSLEGTVSAQPVPESEQQVVATEPSATDSPDKTKELLLPVTDLITLQGEMQSALSKLASTLEHFATEIVASEDKTASLTNRLQQLEDELESTRERLRLAEEMMSEPVAKGAGAVKTEPAEGPAGEEEAPAAEQPATEPAPESAPAAGATSVPPSLPGAPAPTPKQDKMSAAAVAPPPLPGALPPLPGAPPALPGAPPALPGAPATAGTAAPPPLPGAPPPLGAAPPPPLPSSPPLGTAPPPPLPAKAIGTAAGGETAAPAKPPTLPKAEAPAPPAAPGAKAAVPPAPPVKPSAAKAPAATAAAGLAAAGAGAAASNAPPLPAPPAATLPATPAPPAVTPPATPAPPAAQPLSGAASAMQKLLRGRKTHQEAPPEEPEPAPAVEAPGLTFRINEVQAAQRYFNESAFVKKIRDISRSIGKPKANLSRPAENTSQAFVTVFWDIVWYQYLVDLRRELPAGVERVALEREGMDPGELEPRFREKNATVNDDGRIDASELEVGLLSDPNALITEMDDLTPEETRLRDDATEEIWDQQSAPEFRWD